jgi:hypothetical protein
MKWFKHDSNAHRDTKLKKLMMRHGMAGYGLYFYCLELVSDEIDAHNLKFEIEDDSEVIAFATGMHQQDVELMMQYMVSLGLFESQGGVITCFKLAKRLDQSMTGNPKMRQLIASISDDITEKSANSHEQVMTPSSSSHDTIMTTSCKKRTEEKRRDKNKQQPKELSADSIEVAHVLAGSILSENENARTNPGGWAKDIDLAMRIDNLTKDGLLEVINWIYHGGGGFWKANILSGKKLREKYGTMFVQMNRSNDYPARQSTVDDFNEWRNY